MDGGVVIYPGLPAASDSERLDTMHNVIARYFGSELGPAPLNGLRPSRILELGCNAAPVHGQIAECRTETVLKELYRAIQAAKQFPDAQVLAVDQNPLPDRILPPNMEFHRADVTRELEFEDGTFDIVHSRLVMVHVVDGPETLRRAAKLVKPGGLLLIEETDAMSLAESGGSATRRATYKFKEIQETRGVDVEFGRKTEAIITTLRDFSDIQVKKVSIPFGANTSDEALNQLGLGMKKSLREFVGMLLNSLHDHGMTHELVHEYREEQEQPDDKTVLDMYFCWARRSAK